MVEMAKLKTEDGLVYSCIVRDISAGGAKLRIPRNLQVVGRVLLTSNVLGNERAARVMWQDESSIGIAFDL